MGLVAIHRRLCERDRTPPATAATYLAGWFPGSSAKLVGLGLATAGAGFLVDAAQLHWHVGPDDWPDSIEIGDVPVMVTADHPWASVPNARIAPDPASLIECTIRHLVETVGPLVTACRGLAAVGSVGLWNEIGDSLVLALRQHDGIEVDESMIDVVISASRVAGVPWRSHARVWLVSTRTRPICVGQKGGCCLAHKCPPTEPESHVQTDPDIAAFRARFPPDPGAPRYCSTCSLRDATDCEERQRFWIERRRAADAPTASGD